MKKYVKPMMESEAFAANEYIGACWLMDCLSTSADENILLVGGTIGEAFTEKYQNKEAAINGFDENGGYYVVTGTIHSGSCENKCTHDNLATETIGGLNCGRFWGVPIIGPLLYLGCEWVESYVGEAVTQGVNHHHVSITQKGTSSGPNAS